MCIQLCPEVYILQDMASRLSIAKPDILKALDQLPSRVMRRKDIGHLLSTNRAFWRLAQATTLGPFIKYLLASTPMREIRLALPHRPETLYVWRDASPFAIAAAAKPNAYLCHYTAMQLHDLTLQVPETIYANFEQKPNPSSPGSLTQLGIDNAFKRPQRVTTNICEMEGHRLCLINGKHTKQLGVEDRRDEFGQPYRATGLERTLIDIAVRPYYAGGVSEVLGAYQRAAQRVSVNKLAATLQKMEFVYPYEQAIGFYLEHSGAVQGTRLDLLRGHPFEFDFYLTYGMKKTEYSPRWRIFFPAGL